MTIALTTLIALPGSSPASTGGTGSGAASDVAATSTLSEAFPAGNEGERKAALGCPPNSKPVPNGCIPRSAVRVVAGERCKSARLATTHYRALTWTRQVARGGELADRTPIVKGRTCRWARVVAAPEWQARARSARRALERWSSERLLRDYRFCDGCHAWHKAVREVQRVFPGTAAWLLSCSGAEGGHGRWVGFSGVAYSTWLRDSDTVGGPLQFRFSTFTGMYRRGVDHVVGRGYRVPRMDSTTAWRSALGQAIAGGWARFTGNDDSHWSASWGNGC